MITLWVYSKSCVRPRRMHRWRYGDNKTVCGIYARRMQVAHPDDNRGQLRRCHICFRYLYRFNSLFGMRR